MPIKIKSPLASCHYPYCTDEEIEVKYSLSPEINCDIMKEKKIKHSELTVLKSYSSRAF